MRVIGPACGMCTHEIRQTIWPEVSACQRAGREQQVLREATQVATDPGSNRSGEALLTPVHVLRRDDAVQRFLQQILPLAALDLQRRRESHGELDKLAIQEWRANLEGCGH